MANNPQTPSVRAEMDDPTEGDAGQLTPSEGDLAARRSLPLPLGPGSSVGFLTSGDQDTTSREAPGGLHLGGT